MLTEKTGKVRGGYMVLYTWQTQVRLLRAGQTFTVEGKGQSQDVGGNLYEERATTF